ncbi:porin family protein [Flammeovirga sp. SubArs3]|uniref:porin family protein n=1 Tax=Flammeovirga sp. SubArs3 TaxID=2995316 RepID=UPI00248C1842|nr:porin family protein [Flammeovirga sp. SubArs3]
MRKFLTLITVFFGCTLSIYAQGVLGVRGGLSSSGLLVEDPNGGLVHGFVGGITYDVPMNQKFSLGIEVNYAQQGVYSLTDETMAGSIPMTPDQMLDVSYQMTGRTDIKLHYINIPIVAKYAFGENGNFKLFGGGQIGFKLGQDVQWSDGEYTLTANGEDASHMLPEAAKAIYEQTGMMIPYTDEQMQAVAEGQEFKNIDISVVFGASYQFGDSPFGLDFRVNYGLTDINNSPDPDLNGKDYMNNMNIQFTATYALWGHK